MQIKKRGRPKNKHKSTRPRVPIWMHKVVNILKLLGPPKNSDWIEHLNRLIKQEYKL